MKSGNHAAARKSDSGEWTCEACGGESMDFELFEEYGHSVNCLSEAAPEYREEDDDSANIHPDVKRARDFIDAMKDVNDATKSDDGESVEIRDGSGEVIKGYKTATDTTENTINLSREEIAPVVIKRTGSGFSWVDGVGTVPPDADTRAAGIRKYWLKNKARLCS